MIKLEEKESRYMKAAVFDGKALKIREKEVPKINKDQVLIKVKAVGICGTDLAIIDGTLPVQPPIIPGHEFSGEVIEIGENVDDFWLNKRVTSEINTELDFNCYYCSKKMHSQCISRKALGIDKDGALAEYLATESYLLHEIPKEISFEQATFIEPLAAAYQTFEMMPIEEEDHFVAIFGMGKLGLLISQIVLNEGLYLIAIDGSEKKLELAKEFGAQHLINRNECKNIPETIRELTNGVGADIVIDATGNPNVMNDLIDSCRARGKIHVKSTHGMNLKINITDLVVREIKIFTSRCGPFTKAIQALKSKKIEVDPLISAKYSLDDIKLAFENYKKERDHVKSIIIF